MVENPVCKRCGLCCHLTINGVFTNKPCKHMVRLKSGKTLCRIYNKRIGQDLGDGNKCVFRESVPFNYEGCEFNKEGQQMLKFGEKIL